MYNARYLLNGRVVCGLDGISQAELTIAYEAKERPRCMCVRGGAEMYIAKHARYVIKRMPGTAPQHHPSCDSFEPEASVSGRGAMLGTAIVSTGPESFEVHVDFPLARTSGRIRTVPQSREGSDVNMPAPRLTLQALTHFLFEQAGFHRWSPSMAGRRSQGVVHKYLTVAASEVRIKGGCLGERFYFPEPFDERLKADIAARRNSRFALLQQRWNDNRRELAIVIGEFKDVSENAGTVRLRIKHMTDAPLIMDSKLWQKARRKFEWMFDLAATDTCDHLRIVMCLLIYAKQEHVLHVDTATCMLTSKNWIPLDAAFETELAAKLTEEGRRFLKPLRYGAKPSEPFPNFLLLDTGSVPTPLFVLSGFMSKEALVAKEKVIEHAGGGAWVWRTGEPIPSFPIAVSATSFAGTG